LIDFLEPTVIGRSISRLLAIIHQSMSKIKPQGAEQLPEMLAKSGARLTYFSTFVALARKETLASVITPKI